MKRYILIAGLLLCAAAGAQGLIGANGSTTTNAPGAIYAMLYSDGRLDYNFSNPPPELPNLLCSALTRAFPDWECHKRRASQPNPEQP